MINILSIKTFRKTFLRLSALDLAKSAKSL